MLQQLRDQTQSTGFKILVLAIILVLTLFGFGATNLFLGTTPSIAEVGDFEINEALLSVETERERRRLLSQMGPDFDPNDIDRLQLQNYALEQLISRQVIHQAARDLGLSFSEAEVNQRLLESPVYQVGGEFNEALYRQQLQMMGFTPLQFIQEVQQGLGSELLRGGVASTSFAADWETARAMALLNQRRDIAYLSLDVEDYLAQLQVSDDDVALRYEEDKSSYVTEATVDIEWVELSLASLIDSVVVDDSEDVLREIYQQDIQALAENTQRDSAHILILVDDSADEAAALASINEAAARLRAGEDFAAVAQDVSQDPGSAASGGNLGPMTKGSFDQAFEDALWALEAPGQVSEPVRSEFGYHLIRLNEISEPELPSFDDEKAGILARLRDEAALAALDGKIDELEQRAFEERYALTETAEQLALQVQQAQGVTAAGISTDNQEQGAENALLSNGAVLEALFSTEGIDGENSAVIRLSDNRAVVVRVTQYNPEQQLELTAVAQTIADQLKLEAAQSKIEADKAQALAQLDDGASVTDVANALGKRWTTRELIGRNQIDQAPQAVLDQAFSLARPQAGERTVGAAVTPTGSALIVLTRVVAGDVNATADALVAQLAEQLAARDQQREFGAFFAAAEEAIGVSRAQ